MALRTHDHTPNFVQRMKSRNKNPYIPLSARYSLDYMGNSYFESGLLAKAIREMHQQSVLGMGEFKIDEIKIYYVFNPMYYTEPGVQQIIRDIWDNKIWMEERTNFNRRSWTMRKTDEELPNAWFEIERGLFWTWEKINLADMRLTFKHHVQYLEYNRRMRAECKPPIRNTEFDRKIHIP